MKHLEEMEAGQTVHEISLRDFLISTGALLAFWASELAFTDAAYAANWLDENTEIMATHSECLWVYLQANFEALRDVMMPIPEGIEGTVVFNPNRGNSMSGKDEPNDPSNPTAEGVEPNIGDIPF